MRLINEKCLLSYLSPSNGNGECTMSILRPQVMLFSEDDEELMAHLANDRQEPHRKWKNAMHRDRRSRLCVLEIGAGTRVPTIRRAAEDAFHEFNEWHKGKRPPAVHIRINPADTYDDFSYICF